MTSTLRRVVVPGVLGVLAGPVFVAVVGETLDNAGIGLLVVAAVCLVVAAVAGRLLRSWPFAVAMAVSSLAYLGFVVWVTSGWESFGAV